MSRTESSVSASIAQLVAEDEERRKERVQRANEHRMQQQRLVVEAQARLAQEAQGRAELAARAIQEQSSRETEEQYRRALEERLLLERTRIEAEQAARTATQRLEHQQEMERLALQRDARVRALEGQRGLLLGGLLTLLVGVLVLYGGLIAPAKQRLQQSLKDEANAHRAERLSLEDGQAALRGRLRDAATIVATKDAELRALRLALERASKEARGPTSHPVNAQGGGRPSQPACHCDRNDPLCDCW